MNNQDRVLWVVETRWAKAACVGEIRFHPDYLADKLVDAAVCELADNEND